MVIEQRIYAVDGLPERWLVSPQDSGNVGL
jgi:hypothetical protein